MFKLLRAFGLNVTRFHWMSFHVIPDNRDLRLGFHKSFTNRIWRQARRLAPAPSSVALSGSAA